MCAKMAHIYYINNKCVRHVCHLVHKWLTFSKPPMFFVRGDQRSKIGVKTYIYVYKKVKNSKFLGKRMIEAMEIKQGHSSMRKY